MFPATKNLGPDSTTEPSAIGFLRFHQNGGASELRHYVADVKDPTNFKQLNATWLENCCKASGTNFESQVAFSSGFCENEQKSTACGIGVRSAFCAVVGVFTLTDPNPQHAAKKTHTQINCVKSSYYHILPRITAILRGLTASPRIPSLALEQFEPGTA